MPTILIKLSLGNVNWIIFYLACWKGVISVERKLENGDYSNYSLKKQKKYFSSQRESVMNVDMKLAFMING